MHDSQSEVPQLAWYNMNPNSFHNVLAADPPWKFSDKLPGRGRGADRHYSTLTVDQLERFPLPAMAFDSLLFLWKVASMPDEALRVVRAWGFTPKTEIVWLKTTKTGKPHFGMGRYVRAAHESCIVATRGRANRLIKSRSIRSVFSAPVGRHSEKPDAFYELVEQLVDGPYAELFARRQRPGWTCMGGELGDYVDLENT
jgi:N6-adenosine-specific RNA methylase IME4